MQEILELCVRLDTRAQTTYRELAANCPNAGVATVFEQLAKEEGQHVEWWDQLLQAWKDGLLPDIADEHGMLERLNEVEQSLEAHDPLDCTTMSTDDMLSLAASLEFYMLDPVFGELIDLMQPGSTIEHRDAYARHVMRLIETIESNFTANELSGFLARVLRRAYRDQQRLAALATRDQLTGLYNRRGLYSHLTQWLSWSRRYNRPLGIALIDIDRFKQINDAYGHVAGDEALEQVARCLESATRSSDIVGRFGGDEFLVLAPELDMDELTQLLDRIVAMVKGTPLSVDTELVTLTVSAGGAWIRGGGPISPEEAVAAADRSLYAAKEAGRDRAGRPHVAGPTAAA